MVRLPLSARHRRVLTYAKLLRRVARHAQTGFDFDGELLRPGDLIAESQLRPSSDYPAVPILLECAGPARPGRGHSRTPETYILWRYESIRAAWNELARVEAEAWDWAPMLGPVAYLALMEQWSSEPPAEACAVAEAVDQVLVEQLERARPQDRTKVMAIIHDRLAVRTVEQFAPPGACGLTPRGPASARVRAARAA